MPPRLFRRCAARPLPRPRAGAKPAHRDELRTVMKPADQGVVMGVLADLVRGRPALVAENAFLRHQLSIPRRGVTRPRRIPADRAILVLPAGRSRAWRQALLIVQPETPLRWHRQGDRVFWRRESRLRSTP